MSSSIDAVCQHGTSNAEVILWVFYLFLTIIHSKVVL